MCSVCICVHDQPCRRVAWGQPSDVRPTGVHPCIILLLLLLRKIDDGCHCCGADGGEGWLHNKDDGSLLLSEEWITCLLLRHHKKKTCRCCTHYYSRQFIIILYLGPGHFCQIENQIDGRSRNNRLRIQYSTLISSDEN